MNNSSTMHQSSIVTTGRNPITANGNGGQFNPMLYTQSIKEITNGSIREEESHCLKKLTRVLS